MSRFSWLSSKKIACRAVLLYLLILFASCVYMLVNIQRDKMRVDEFFTNADSADYDDYIDDDLLGGANGGGERYQEGMADIGKMITGALMKPFNKIKDFAKKPIESIKEIFTKVKNMMKMFQRVIKGIASLSPRVTYLGIAMTNFRQGVVSDNSSMENGVSGGFEWFKRHVKWIEKVDCYWIYLINMILTMIGKFIFAIVAGIFNFIGMMIGVDMSIDSTLIFVQLWMNECFSVVGLSYPKWITDCYACDGCLSANQIDHRMKYLTNAYHHNAKTHYLRANCAMNKALAPF